MTNERIVWLLGAGFSKPLGVPLTRELFQPRELSLAAEFIEKAIPSEQALTVLRHQVGRESGQAEGFYTLTPAQCARGVETLDRTMEFLLRTKELHPANEARAQAMKKLRDDLGRAHDKARRRRSDEPRTPVSIPHNPYVDDALIEFIEPLRSAVRDVRTAQAVLPKLQQPNVGVEQLLWQLERAAVGEPEAKAAIMQEIEDTLGKRGETISAERLYHATKRLIVAQLEYACSLNQESRWRPYKEWARLLVERQQDAILSFNYDRVVELAFQRAGWQLPHNFLKLHGGLDRHSIDKHLLWLHGYGGGEEPKLGLPGDEKDRAADQSMWDSAVQALHEASAVVVLGYSFPPDDVQSLELLSSGLSGNRHGRKLPLTVALGADTANVERITDLVHRRPPESTSPLYTVDCLHSRSREALLGLRR